MMCLGVYKPGGFGTAVGGKGVGRTGRHFIIGKEKGPLIYSQWAGGRKGPSGERLTENSDDKNLF